MPDHTTTTADDTSGRAAASPAARPAFPRRAVVTAGMPYGNKGLHFGHIGGVFIPADVYARFLRDRIGHANVLFISGTDCYGSPIDEGYRKLVEGEGFTGSIEDYVLLNHQAQARTLAAYDISLDIFEGSGLLEAKAYHQEMTNEVFWRLHGHGHLRWLSTAQFYDQQVGVYLNGRQVEGRCPWPNCDSEQAYADECSLGHSYQPEELLDPISTLSGQPPVMRETANWYLDLISFKPLLSSHIAELRESGATRKVVTDTISEFMLPPIAYVRSEHSDDYLAIAAELPPHDVRWHEGRETSFDLEFASLVDRDAARTVLDRAGIRFRTGKTLTPFRLTGNIAWGVPAPALPTPTLACSNAGGGSDAGAEGLTVWVWPESLWAPISFTRAYLGQAASGRAVSSLNADRSASDGQTWQDYWCDPDSTVYQFIGQDNIYFYGVAQTPLFAGYNGPNTTGGPSLPGQLQQTRLVANFHLLYFGRKASSSGAVRPPMADELLDHYTSEQLRAHFVALGLSLKQASFRPKPLNPDAGEKDPDPVLKDGQVLTNILNRLARSCFYTAQSEMGGNMPLGEPSAELLAGAQAAVLAYEQAMSRQELHVANQIAAAYVREANKHWSEQSKLAIGTAPRRQLLVDCFYLLRVSLMLMHPIAPAGTRKVLGYLLLDSTEADFFSWQHIDADGIPSGYDPFLTDASRHAKAHALRELPPRTDFFERHPSQFS
jgi:methionyl-tRNA synthetase